MPFRLERGYWIISLCPIESPNEPTLFRPSTIQADLGESPWYKVLFEDGRNAVAVISDDQARPLATKPHSDHNEFWIVLQGEYEYLIRERSYDNISEGDVIVCSPGTIPKIRPVSEIATRLVVYKPNYRGNSCQMDRESLSLRNKSSNPSITKRTDMLIMSQRRRKHTIISDDRNSVFLIRETPGTASQAHWHFDFDEWWYVLMGEMDFSVGQNRPLIHAIQGDVVFVPRGFRHQITTVGTGPSLRIPVTNAEGVHIWTDDDNSAPPPRQ